MDEDTAFEAMQASAAVMLAYYRKPPTILSPAADRVFSVLCERTFGNLKSEAQISRADFMDATGLTQSTVSIALGRLLELGVISRRSPGHKQPYIYRVEREGVMRLAA